MAFSNDEITQLRTVVREEMRAVVHDEVRGELESALQPIKDDIAAIKVRLDRFFEMESGDIKAAYKEINLLKKQINHLKMRLDALKGNS